MAPRLEPLPPGEWPEEMNAALAAIRPAKPRHELPSRAPGRPKGLNVLGTLALHPELAKAFNTLTGHALFATTLSTRQRELLILRVAAVRRCEYEWRQHVVLGRDAGLTDDEIRRVANAPHSGEWSVAERALLDAVDELLEGARIHDDTWAALRPELDDQQLMDLVFTVGTYDALAMAMLSFGTEPDADLQSGNAILFNRET